MSVWCRINQAKQLSRQFKRCYFQIPHASSLNHTPTNPSSLVTQNPYWIIPRRPNEFCDNVRFYAAPVQYNQKQEERDKSGPLLNEKIRAQYVRLVTKEGHFVVSRLEALERAKKAKLDLVEVDKHADPPVCKIMDFHKERFEKQTKDKERAKSKSEVTLRKGDCKEVRFSGKTEQKDLKIKADAVKRLMERGYRVKCMAMGTEDQDLGGLLLRLTALIEDVSLVESGPRVEKKQAYVIVRHVKFGPSKKGVAKKLKDLREPISEVGKSLKTEDETLTDEDDSHVSSSRGAVDSNLDDKNAWSISDSNDDFSEVFGFTDDASEGISRSANKQMNAVPETASFPTNLNIADSLRLRPVLDSVKADRQPSTPPQPSFVSENRYKKSEAMNQFPSPNSINNRGPGVRDSVRVEPQFSHQRRQPPDFNISPSAQNFKPTESIVDRVPPARNPVRLEPQFPSQRTQLPKDLNIPPPKQILTGRGASGKPSSFGIFSAKPTASGKQSVAADINRSKEGTQRR